MSHPAPPPCHRPQRRALVESLLTGMSTGALLAAITAGIAPGARPDPAPTAPAVTTVAPPHLDGRAATEPEVCLRKEHQVMTVPLPETAVDWTALRNFAMLRGQLRVSLTPKCNEKCWFCHNEGDVPPPFTHLHRDAFPVSAR
ncbi:hypothetical protein [Streptomyces acidicola]|uniref:hypothetical protein n=1 Tax=Streptomyces acidicola TaxID=2596892 RepID=UPI0034150BA0